MGLGDVACAYHRTSSDIHRKIARLRVIENLPRVAVLVVFVEQ
jgi:hypothetical protein